MPNTKYLLIYDVTNQNDSGAMGDMARRAKSIVKHNGFSLLFDKGYHSGKELSKVQELGIDAYVAIPKVPITSQAPNPSYNVENFKYDHSSDTYTCPANQTLTTNQKWYKTPNYRFKQYKTKACEGCSLRSECTLAKNGKIIQRSEFQDAVEKNKQNILANPELYKRRQALVEHPFGTMKRQWGFDYIMTKKTKARASADVGFIFIAYNLRRLFNIIAKDQLTAYLRACIALFLATKIHLRQYILLQNPIKQVLDKIQEMRLFLSRNSQYTTTKNFGYFHSGF